MHIQREDFKRLSEEERTEAEHLLASFPLFASAQWKPMEKLSGYFDRLLGQKLINRQRTPKRPLYELRDRLFFDARYRERAFRHNDNGFHFTDFFSAAAKASSIVS